jgi:hypothetical protein
MNWPVWFSSVPPVFAAAGNRQPRQVGEAELVRKALQAALVATGLSHAPQNDEISLVLHALSC